MPLLRSERFAPAGYDQRRHAATWAPGQIPWPRSFTRSRARRSRFRDQMTYKPITRRLTARQRLCGSCRGAIANSPRRDLVAANEHDVAFGFAQTRRSCPAMPEQGQPRVLGWRGDPFRRSIRPSNIDLAATGARHDQLARDRLFVPIPGAHSIAPRQ